MAGETIGRFQIIREIGRGAAAVVYEAQDTQINRAVAIKVLSAATNLTGTARRQVIERFYREARSAGKLSHPNIAQVYDVGEDSGRHYIAMELCHGVNLRDMLHFEHRIDETRLKSMAMQILNALEAAHAAGIVHRDIKPENIVVGQGDRIKLTDFGIAKVLTDATMTQTGMMLGTPAYMSPEQVMGKDVDARSDLFSLGAVLYECLSGQKPFGGDSITAIAHKIAYEEPEPLSGVASPWPEIVMRALCKAPTNRYQCATDMLSDVRADRAPAQPQPASPTPQQVNQTINVPGPTAGASARIAGQRLGAGSRARTQRTLAPLLAGCGCLALLFLLSAVFALVSIDSALRSSFETEEETVGTNRTNSTQDREPATPSGRSDRARHYDHAAPQWEPATSPGGPQFTVGEWRFIRGAYTSEIIGVVRNNTSRTFGYAQIEFSLYDRYGRQVGSTFDNICNLDPYGIWRFEAIVLEDDAVSARFAGITVW